MSILLDATQEGMERVLTHSRLARDSSEIQRGLIEKVSATILRVRRDKDAALVACSQQWDDPSFSVEKIALSPSERKKIMEQCPKESRAALEFAAERIRAYHEAQMPKSFEYTDASHVTLGNRWVPMARVGLYVPGGKASYPSSVLMNAIPARVAGVTSLAMVVPAPKGEMNALVVAAAEIAGVEEIYRVGGAQAIAALAYGTETIPAVDKIVGPGNAYVAEAKRQVFGVVGIDMIAGPSEVLVVADGSANPAWVAADLLSQAEHDEQARAILVTLDSSFARAVLKEVDAHLRLLSRATIARESWKSRGAVIVVGSKEDALRVIDHVAPEHLELCVEAPGEWVSSITHAGAIFLGHFTPEAVGDYVAGPSHVLPTSGSARFSSGLSVYDFLRRQSVIQCSRSGFDALAKATRLLAQEEGLTAHALSVSLRADGA